jgi:predicted nucleic acid-binding protein
MPSRPLRVALDSSFLIALIADWHAQHPRTLRSYDRWLAERAQVLVPWHAVAECYSVLTRLPAPYRFPTQVAHQSLSQNIAKNAMTVALEPQQVWRVIEDLARLGITGGQVYDALIAASAAEARAHVLMTWNPKHFVSVAPAGLQIREPD